VSVVPMACFEIYYLFERFLTFPGRMTAAADNRFLFINLLTA
jgi:hypothetical protein